MPGPFISIIGLFAARPEGFRANWNHRLIDHVQNRGINAHNAERNVGVSVPYKRSVQTFGPEFIPVFGAKSFGGNEAILVERVIRAGRVWSRGLRVRVWVKWRFGFKGWVRLGLGKVGLGWVGFREGWIRLGLGKVG